MIAKNPQRAALPTGGNRTAAIAQGIWGAFVALMIAAAPKCPLCWAGYMSLLGLSGTSALALGKWALPLLVGLFVVHLAAIGTRALRRNQFLPLGLSTIGFLAVLIGFNLDVPALRALGVLLVFTGSFTSALPSKCDVSVRANP